MRHRSCTIATSDFLGILGDFMLCQLLLFIAFTMTYKQFSSIQFSSSSIKNTFGLCEGQGCPKVCLFVCTGLLKKFQMDFAKLGALVNMVSRST